MSEHSSACEVLAVPGLLAAALFWGITYPLTKFVEGCPTFYIIAVRFGTAAVFLAILFHRRFRKFHTAVLKASFLLSFCITLMYVFSIVGIKYTTSVRASFFTTLSFLIVPVLNRIFFRVPLSRIIVTSAMICLAGAFLLCYSPDMGGVCVNPGDLICLIAAACGSLHIIFVERVTRREEIDPTLFTILLMGFVSLWGTLIGLATGDLFLAAPTSSQLAVIVFMGVVCSAAAFTLQSNFERIVPANRTGVIFSLEPASGCVMSVLFLGETMELTAWIGAAVMMGSILYMEIATSRSGQAS